MINSYNITEQELNTNDVVDFTVDNVKTGCTVIHTPGTGVFTLAKPGFYYVTLSAVGAASAAGTDPITLALFNGATAIPGATSSATSTSATDVVNLTVNCIIPVRPSCCAINNTVYLSVVNTGVDATFSNATITITKIS